MQCCDVQYWRISEKIEVLGSRYFDMKTVAKCFNILLFCLFLTFVVMILLNMAPMSPPTCDCSNNPKNIALDGEDESHEHSMCVIVPFRDRLEELVEFAPYLHNFLNKQHIKHKIFIVNQADSHRFNRASLINVGFVESKNSCDYIAMHDVDLLPLNPELSYSYPSMGPFHLASPDLHPRYHYKTFVGGILLLQRAHFEMVNGLSNKYWGWGLEDDEFYVRMKSAGLNVSRPLGITTGTRNTFLHLHDKGKRKRDTVKLFNQKEVTRRRDRVTGLNTVKYRLIKRHEIVIDGAPVTMLNVELICDHKETAWCDHTLDDPASKKATVVSSTPKDKTQ